MSNKHDVRWVRQTSFWDDLAVPDGIRGADVFSWLDTVAPLPEEHDYVLSTDGSGCVNGWGASASVIEEVWSHPDGTRRMGDARVLVSSTYGSTVQRRELSAFLDGMHEILRMRMETLHRDAEFMELIGESCSRRDMMDSLMDSGRIRVLWYTDRMNLAGTFLFGESDEIIAARSSEADLWLRYSYMARYFCVTPMCLPRNQIPSQAVCDNLCSIARRSLLAVKEELVDATQSIKTKQWNQKQPQKALF